MTRLSSKLGETVHVPSPQHVCVYGSPKAGKTQLIGELALAGFKLIWFDLENGAETLRKMPQEALDNITHIGVRDVKDEPIAISTMDKIVRGGKFSLCDYHGRIDCPLCKKDGTGFTDVDIPTRWELAHADTIVVMDSATQLSFSVISHVIKGKPIDYQETLHDFRNQGNYLNRIFSYIQYAPFNFITTAHETEAEREDGSIRIVPSIGSRNYAINCGKFFDHVVYMDKINMKHKAFSSTQYSNSVLTGSRTDFAIEKQERPDLVGIFRGTSGSAAATGQGAGQNVAAKTSSLLLNLKNKAG
jgi:hypothetical protein